MPIRRVILAPGDEPGAPLDAAYTAPGTLVDSGAFGDDLTYFATHAP